MSQSQSIMGNTMSAKDSTEPASTSPTTPPAVTQNSTDRPANPLPQNGLSILNDPPKFLNGPRILHELIKWTSDSSAVALEFDDGVRRHQYSYESLHKQVLHLASTILKILPQTQGSAQQVIPILLPQSPALYIAEYGILQAGAAFCPLVMGSPQERLTFVVNDVQASLVITTAEFKEILSWKGGPELLIISEFPEAPVGDVEHVRGEVKPEELAYVMYTSGSSGTPKGVAVSHLAAAQSLLAHDRHIPAFERFLQFAAPSFDVSVFEIFFPLFRAKTLVACNRSRLLNDLCGVINALEVDACELTPTVAGALVQKREFVPGLKTMLTIGEMLTRPVVEEFGGSGEKRSILYGMYGPTEAAIHCTVHEAMSSSINAGNIGIPFDTVTTYIAAAQSTDPENYNFVEILPVGEWGELILAGPQVANGYLNRPDQNAQAFITYKDSKAYRTGDKARMLPDGTMEMAGRMSSGQVKLRGQRVELGEIEQAIYKNPDVKVAFVTVLNGILVSFIQGDVTMEEVKETCRKWLPEFMVPTQVAILETFLYLPSGKIDRKRLEKEFSERMMEEEEDVEPLNEQEQPVREVLKEVLGVSLGRTSELPAAGLDSLLAIRVAGKLRGLGYQLTPVEVLKAETLEILTKMCINLTSKAPTLVADSTPDYKNIISDVIKTLGADFDISLFEAVIPCTPVQIAMLSETIINSKAYRNWVVVNLPTKNLSSESARLIFQQLAKRNPILRTRFVESSVAWGFAQLIMKDLADSCFQNVQNVSEFNSDMFPKSTENVLDPLSIQVVETSSYVSLGINIHHALYDAWSLELMLDDLDQLLVQWQQENMPENSLSRPSYSDFVAAYHNGTLVIDSQNSKNYWEAHLASFDPLSIPNFHSKSGTLPGLEVFQLQTTLSTTKLESAARSLGVAPQAIFQAAYAVVLGSYVGSSDVCFGTVFSGRTLPVVGIEDMMGPCLSTLPVRVEISRTDSVKSLIQQLNAVNRRHLEYSTLPLRDIKKSAGIDPGTALFDSILVWQQTLHSQNLKREIVVLSDTKDFLEFSLTVEITPDVKNIHIKANYQRALFPLRQIELLLGQIESLTKTFLEGIDGSVLDAQLVMNEEVLSIENPTPDMHLSSNSLPVDVERFALSHPDNIAIDFATSLCENDQEIHSVSYRELNESANRIAHHLIAESVIPDDPVCIFMEKSAQLYASILATAKAGAGYVPVTPETPFERLHYIVKEADVKVLISTISLRSVLQALTDVKIIYLEDLDVATLPVSNPVVESHPDNLAYCVYTSGSTGTPKGVQVTQGNMIANLDFLQTIYPTYDPSRLLQSCSQAFDVSVFEIFFAWRIGGTLCSATKDTLFRDIEYAIQVLQISHLSLTPTVAALINPDNVPTVKFLVTAGEAVTQKVFNLWAGRGLFQGYGPSETTNICTVLPNVAKENYINIIGPTFKNTSAFVLAPDEFLPLPHGAEGEFCFGGVQVFRGYLNKVQNEGRIVVHEKFGRIYRSGDFGRIMPDGSLAFTGRKDEQVKIRGQRVELGEINSVMLKLPSIKDCVTLVVDSKTTSAKRLICFFVATKPTIEGEIPEGIIEECYVTLKAALPIYMIPSALIPVEKLPSTTQGKIDKRLLVRHYQSLSIEFLNSTSNKQPSEENHTWTPLQSNIATAVSQIAGLTSADVGPHTNFFSVGIDSISAIALSRKLREQGIHIDISDILKNPEVVRLSERIIELEKHSQDFTEFNEGFKFGDEFVVSIKEKFETQGLSVDKILPCTPLQEAMLSASEGQGSYTNRVVLDVRGDVQKLRKCFETLIQRHDILRTAFVQADDKNFVYAQVVLNDFSPLYEISQAELRPPYSLNFVEKEDKVLLELCMHHALYDGVAMSLIYAEIEKLYVGRDLPSPISFQPFLEYMSSQNLNAADKFWDRMLAGFKPVSFPDANPAAGSIKTSISSSIPLSSIESLVKKNSTSLLSVCQASWAALLSTYTSTPDVCFGNIVSGRTVPVSGTDSLIAPTFNTLPIRLDSLNNITHLETFRKLQDINVESLVYQLTPLRRIQGRAGGRLFDTLFLMQQEAEVLDSGLWELKEDEGEMDLPVVLEVIPEVKTGILRVWLHVRGLSEVQAQTILKTFDAFLKKSLEKPFGRLLDLGSIDKTLTEAIPKPVKETKSTTAEDGKEGSVPSSEVEIKIRDAYAAFTNVNIDMIKRNTSIYRLGIDSISAVQVASRLRKDGYLLLASDVLQHPNISDLSVFISTSSASLVKAASFDFADFESKHRAEVLQKVEGDVKTIRPCTPVQCGMIAQSIHSDGKEYFNSLSMDLPSNMDISRFRNAWETVARTHEMLRTGFVSVDDTFFPFAMVIYSPENFKLPWFTSSVEISDVSKYLQSIPWSLQHSEITGNVVKFAAHHALYDAHSINLILSDVARIYDDQAPASSSSIDSLLGAILISSMTSDEQEEFWKADEHKLVVSKFPDLTPLRISGSTSYVEERICAASLEFLEQSCREQSATMQSIGEAAWAKLLAAYSGEFSVSFGVTLSGRSIIPEADSIVFPSIVTVPRRCDVVGTNAELISRTMSFNAATTKFQFTPLAHIQRWSGFPEGKVFDTLFAYQKSFSEEFEVPWTVVNEEASVDYAISIELQPSDEGLILRLTFRENLVPIEQARTILSQMEALMMDLLQNPEKSAASAPVAGNDILSITPANEPIIPCEVELLHEFVTVQAQKTPDKIALEFATNLHAGEFNSRKWTYSQLERESNRVANMLLQKGVQPGGLVAICFDKCAEASISIVGIMKTGCAYVALDPNAPPDRLNYIVSDSGATLALSAGKPAETLKDNVQIELIAMDNLTVLQSSSDSKPVLSRKIDPEDTSYCLYTSGTTGTPKGCSLTHSNAVQAMLAFQRLFSPHWDEDSKWLQFASFHFDVSVLEQFWSWSVGICVASAPRDLIFEDIPGAIQQLGITHIDLTPSLARLLTPEEVPSLCKGVFITGGEQLKQEILDTWGEKMCIYNGYGPTEATIGVTMYPRVPQNGKPANIGPQFDNVGSYVLTPDTFNPVIRGAIGELCVSGALVGKGYLNRPELTAEKFPFVASFGERIYRTGDLVRIIYDGTFIFLGRADDQVKLRGQRLELSEINEVAKKVDGVEEVVTLVLKHPKQIKEQLVMFFVTTRAGQKLKSEFIGGEAVRDHVTAVKEVCKGHLPGYMVPTHFLALTTFPLNPNNKNDAKRLAQMYNELTTEDLQSLSRESENTKGFNDDEKKVVEVLAGAFGMDPESMTRDMNIFELGIDSISIIGLSRTLVKAGYSNAKLAIVMGNPSIGSLVGKLLQEDQTDVCQRQAQLSASQNIVAFAHKHTGSILQELGVDRNSVESVAPATPMQEGMIYRFLNAPDALYFLSFEFALQENIDLEKLRAAWEAVHRGVQILRTKFVITDDGHAQVALKNSSLPWEIVETDSFDYSNIEKTSAIKEPYRVTIKKSVEKSNMVLRIFHGLYDGNSLPMILSRVAEHYQGKTDIDFGPPFQSALPYGPMLSQDGAKEFWQRSVPIHQFPSMPCLAKQPSNIDVAVSATITDIENIEEFRQRMNTTYQAILQAAWASVIQEYLSTRLTFGMVSSGRSIDLENADRVIGPLFNTIPFFLDINCGMTWKSLIKACHDFNVAALPFQHTPLKNIQKWCSSGNTSKDMFDTLFVFQREDEDEQSANTLWKEVDGKQVADYPLAFEARLLANGNIEIVIVAQGQTIDAEAASTLLNKMKASMQIAVSQPDTVLEVNEPSSPTLSTSTDGFVFVDTPRPSPEDENSFVWTEQAKKVRNELAVLTAMSVEAIGAYTPIFELGLDSIDVIKLSSRLKHQQVVIPVSAIIKAQTIAKIVDEIQNATTIDEVVDNDAKLRDLEQKLSKHLEASNRLPSNVKKVLPATPLQEAMVAEMLNSGYTRYFNHEVLKVDPSTDLIKLQSAWDAVIEQTDIFRTTFIDIEDAEIPVIFGQLVHHPSSGGWTYRELSETADLDAELYLAFERARKSAEHGGPLLQLSMLQYQKQHYLVLSISHALYDGSSIQMLHEDVKKAYENSLSVRPDPEVVLQDILSSNEKDAMEFWKTTLSGAPSTSFPTRRSQENELVHRFEHAMTTPIDKIQAFCRTSGISLQTLGQTCWALLLAKYVQRLDVTFGCVLSCRDTEESQEILFPLMNTVTIRAVLHGTILDLLRYMQDTGNAMRKYQHFPLRKAQALADADGRLFDTLFIHQGKSKAGNDSKSLYEAVDGSSEVEYPVCVEMEIVDERLVWRTACQDSARNHVEAEDLLKEIDVLLTRMIELPGMNIIGTNKDGISICGQSPVKDVNPFSSRAIETVMSDSDSPWSEVEITLRQVFSQVSGISEDEISRNQSIYHLGLDSISAIKVSSLLRARGIRFTVNEILKLKTIQKLAQKANDAVGPDSQESYKIQSGNSSNTGSFPVTAGQEYTIKRWALSGGGFFCSTFDIQISGDVDPTKLEKVWQKCFDKLPILQTSFRLEAGQIFQLHEPTYHGSLVIGSKSQIIAELSQSIEGSRFWGSHPVALILDNTGEVSTLHLWIHHALYDGASLPHIISTINGLYTQNDSVINAPASIDSFKNYIRLLQSNVGDGEATREAFWSSNFKKQEQTILHPEKLRESSEQRTELLISKAMSLDDNWLNIRAKTVGVSIQALLITAFAQCVGLLCKQDVVTFGLYVANRQFDDGELIAVPTMNILPIQVEITNNLDHMAEAVAEHLDSLRDRHIAGSSLTEIYKLTGHRVQFVLNILQEFEDNTKPQLEPKFSFKQGDEDGFASFENVVPSKQRFETTFRDDDMAPYMNAIDIEIGERGGMLDIGVFAPNEILDIDEAKAFVEGYKSFLEAIRRT